MPCCQVARAREGSSPWGDGPGKGPVIPCGIPTMLQGVLPTRCLATIMLVFWGRVRRRVVVTKRPVNPVR